MYLKSLLPEGMTAAWRILAMCDNRRGCQVEDFLFTVGPNLKKDADRIRALFKYISELGPQVLDLEISHNIAPEIFEFVRGRIRIVWFYDADKVVICSNGFIKKGQKTPRQEIEIAQSARRDYFAAKAQGKITLLEK